MTASTFTLKSYELGGQATPKQIFKGNGCKGENISPQLSWEHAPADTRSFAITIYDSAAPSGSGWWHWVIFDIPSDVNELVSNAGNPSLDLAPKNAVQSLNDFGFKGYGGPCPPEGHGLHPYLITVHALNVSSLGLDENTNPAMVGFMMADKTVGKASIVMYHKR